MLWIGLYFPLLPLESFAASRRVRPAQSGPTAPVPAPVPVPVPAPRRAPTSATRPATTSSSRLTPWALADTADVADALYEIPLALASAHNISHANAAARALGVTPGLRQATALALVPELVIGQADAVRQAKALQGMAHAALAFTPAVVLSPPHGLLLEVQASLRYFGGFERLLSRLHKSIEPFRFTVQVASAPTAQGAALLSRMDEGLHCVDASSLVQTLDRAPAWLLASGRVHWPALQGMGLHTLGSLRRMPRPGLTRRFGEMLLNELDCALGLRPDPRVHLTLPDEFDDRLELLVLADTSEQVLAGAQLLLLRLVAWASGQHALIRRFSLCMKHEARRRQSAEIAPVPSVTQLDVALTEPSRDADHLLVLLRERLAAMELPAPTLELSLHCSDLARRAAPNSELFPTARSEREGLNRLIERLQARLGPAQVQRLATIPDHRPERGVALLAAEPAGDARLRPKASGGSSGKAQAAASPGQERHPVLTGLSAQPVWLLPLPQALPERHSRPLLNGRPLRLLCGPERLETGWWDAGLAERDYFIAQDNAGALVWIYRTRSSLLAPQSGQGWFLQGLFA